MKKVANKKINKVNETNKRYALVLDTLDRLERGMWTGNLDIHWVCDSIGWLSKWKKITADESAVLCERVIAYFKGEY